MTGSSTEGIKTVLHPVSDLTKAKAVCDYRRPGGSRSLETPTNISELALQDSLSEGRR